MDRRKFIKNISYSGAAAVTLGGIPVNALAGNGFLKSMAAASSNDNVLVFIQLHGGNDALNTVIPVAQFNDYYNLRPNIAIRDFGTRRFINVDTTIDENKQVGLHPDMNSFKEMYDIGNLAIVQNVGYPHMNLSHFRGRDIVFMGADGDDTDPANRDLNSGWMGRFLNSTYPGYPDSYPSDSMPDPIGIELSGSLSLAFHRSEGIPIGLNVGSPEQFYNLINSVGVDAPVTFPDSFAGDELRYIMEFEKKSNQYASRLKEIYDKGENSTTEYPEAYPSAAPTGSKRNPLSPQLQLIARLLAGGIKTRIFLCRIGGFDTHGEQVDRDNSSYGTHAALLYHLSSAVKAFYSDLNILGLDKKVLSMTFTEFGRRPKSNASYGTDHGTSTPIILAGPGLNPGVYGENPDLSDPALKNGANMVYNVDYRRVYTSVVKDWFGASDEALQATGYDEWIDDKLPLIGGSTGINEFRNRELSADLKIMPNPVKNLTEISFFIEKQETMQVELFNQDGKRILYNSKNVIYGVNKVNMNLETFPAGNYVVRIRGGRKVLSGKLLKL